jgi:hypothetical protein
LIDTDANTTPAPQAANPTAQAAGELADREGEETILRAASAATPPKMTWIDGIEAFIARLSSRNLFWHRVCSMIWLPYAFKSGIRMKKVDERTFAAELPFRRFNKNWYNAMAGAALLANSEIAGGMYIFGVTGGDCTIVCKRLRYDFLRPCFGPALYKITPRESLKELLASGKEFNLTLDLEVVQQPLLPQAIAKRRKKDDLLARLAAKERLVGRCVATFHVSPSAKNKAKHGHARAVGRGSDLSRAKP